MDRPFVKMLLNLAQSPNERECLRVAIAGPLLNVRLLNAFHLHNVHASIQAPKDWHLILIVLLITSAAVALVVGKTISQWNPPFLRRDNEESEGKMVRPVIQNFLFLRLVSVYLYTLN